ncbi:MAG: hypothetical protein DLM62_17305 [Pseudonocardiales bacterium]|nr:MAG: hypothetical protein DLM62_17305 [Pseudonocardiales bacterium]
MHEHQREPADAGQRRPRRRNGRWPLADADVAVRQAAGVPCPSCLAQLAVTVAGDLPDGEEALP